MKNSKSLGPIMTTAAGAVDNTVAGRLWTTSLIVQISRQAFFMPLGAP